MKIALLTVLQSESTFNGEKNFNFIRREICYIKKKKREFLSLPCHDVFYIINLEHTLFALMNFFRIIKGKAGKKTTQRVHFLMYHY